MKPDNNLLAWRVLACIGHGGGVKRASIVMGLDQSQCTRLIQNLEAGLGVSLTDHDVRPVGLNELGRRVLPAVEQMLESRSRIGQMIDDARRGSLSLLVAIPANTPRESSFSSMCAYEAADPQLHLSIITDKDHEDLCQGLVDIAYLPYTPEPSPNLCIHPLGSILNVPVAAPGYLSRCGVPQRPSDLAEHVIFLRGGRWYPQTQCLERGLERAPLVFKRVHVGDALTCRQAVLSGAGIALDLAYAVVKSDLEAGNLVPVLRGWHRPQWLPSIVFLATHPQRARIEKFVDFFAKQESAALRKRLHEVTEVLGRLARAQDDGRGTGVAVQLRD